MTYCDWCSEPAGPLGHSWCETNRIGLEERFFIRGDEVPDKIICIAPCVKCGARTASLTEAPTLCVHCDGHAYKTDRLMEGRFCELCDIEDYAHN